MKNFEKKKKAIEVFQTYGIALTGKKKTADFFQELKMDKVFVDGLIYELELKLQKEIEIEKITALRNPSMVLEELLTSVD
ncbi:acyl carrier protein [Cecembia calidifontis]|uniref:Acyl carrier protein n=1 Tax=Cecembia calidifontis TaxID=1187080 RepID=A0A4Q7PD37_9BACT|nr:acyl carrier protein [Cecembia calidifontis]RZS98145.1 acyl carrier protein [Cecembia calidifontis]